MNYIFCCGLSLNVSVCRRSGDATLSHVDEKCQQIDLVQVLVIYVSCTRPISGHIVQNMLTKLCISTIPINGYINQNRLIRYLRYGTSLTVSAA